jgi:hypothetical protein
MVSDNISINNAFEEVNNKVLLTNLLRESKDRPVYFTSLNKVSGSAPWIKINPSLTVPVGPRQVESAAVSVTLDQKYGFSYDITPLADADFIHGILSPISLQTFVEYWNMGWDKEFLLKLMVRDIQFCEVYSKNDVKVIKVLSSENIGPFHDYLVDVLKNKCFVYCHDEDSSVKPEKEKEEKSDKLFVLSGAVPDNKSRKSKEYEEYKVVFGSIPMVATKYPAKYAVVHLRSVESMMNLLGNSIKASLDQSSDFKIITVKDNVPLIYVRKMSSFNTSENELEVEYDGEKYGIPKNTWLEKNNVAGNYKKTKSMMTLSLLSELISLNKKIVEQTTPSVRVIP